MSLKTALPTGRNTESNLGLPVVGERVVNKNLNPFILGKLIYVFGLEEFLSWENGRMQQLKESWDRTYPTWVNDGVALVLLDKPQLILSIEQYLKLGGDEAQYTEIEGSICVLPCCDLVSLEEAVTF